MTLDQVERLQAKAVRFLRDVVRNDDKADDFEAMSPEEYARRKGVEIVRENPWREQDAERRSLRMSKTELEERIAELEAENEDLQSRLDAVMDIVQPEEDDDNGDDEEGEDCDD